MDPFLAAIGVKDDPAPAPAAGATQPWAPKDPLDAAIRTVAAESSGDPTESRWIAGVIANRAKTSKKSLLDVVRENDGKTYQFEPWATPAGRKRMADLDPSSDEYKKLAAAVQPILEGKEEDPTGGAMHFYAPKAQAALGRSKPEFDDGSGAQVGSTMFFGGKATPPDSFLAAVGADPSKADADSRQKVHPTSLVVRFTKGVPGRLNKDQAKTYDQFQKGGYLVLDDPEHPSGTVLNPLWMHAGTSIDDVPDGAYYVDLKGKLKRAPGGPKKEGHILDAVTRGGLDVLQSLGELAPGTQDSSVLNTIQATQRAYNADYMGDPKMGMGRFTGQVLGAAPLTAGSEALLGLKVLGPAGEFLAGRAGGNLAARGASLATSGALEGAEASALTSAAGEGSKKDQIITGAILGGALKPVAKGVETGIRRFVGAPKAAGAVPLEEQTLRVENAKGLPVPVPLSQGEITGAPAQQLAENAMLRGAEGDGAAGVMQSFKHEQQGALRGNVEAITTKMADGKPVEVGDGGKAVSARLNAAHDAMKATVDANYKAAREADTGAHLPRDFRPVLTANVRDAVRDYDPSRVPAVAKILDSLDGPHASPEVLAAGQADRAPIIEKPLEVRELFEARAKLSALRGSTDSIEGGAAGKAVRALDAQIQTALKGDLISGDPKAVDAWRKAIKSRADFGRLFQGDDLIEGLTERVSRGGERDTLKVAPEDATNYIFNRSSLGFVGKKDLKRDLARLRTVLGPNSDAWNTLRAEAFKRVARSGEGAAENGAPQFSGQKFMNAWTKAKADDPQVLSTMFTAEERALIDRFAEVSQRATSPVKGGDNPSNTAITMKKFAEKWFPYLTPSGGAAAGAAVAGPAGAAGGAVMGSFFNALREALKVNKAVKATRGAKPLSDEPTLKNKLIPDLVTPAGAIAGAHLVGSPAPVE